MKISHCCLHAWNINEVYTQYLLYAPSLKYSFQKLSVVLTTASSELGTLYLQNICFHLNCAPVWFRENGNLIKLVLLIIFYSQIYYSWWNRFPRIAINFPKCVSIFTDNPLNWSRSFSKLKIRLDVNMEMDIEL